MLRLYLNDLSSATGTDIPGSHRWAIKLFDVIGYPAYDMTAKKRRPRKTDQLSRLFPGASLRGNDVVA
jgi:hypothetical protein